MASYSTLPVHQWSPCWASDYCEKLVECIVSIYSVGLARELFKGNLTSLDKRSEVDAHL